MIVRAVLRIVRSAAALVALYYALPLNHSSPWAAVTMLVTGLVVFAGLVAFQVRCIYPCCPGYPRAAVGVTKGPGI
jgi:hypothetical protein